MKKRLILLISSFVAVALLLMFGLGLLVTKSNENEITKDNLIDATDTYAAIYCSDSNALQKINGTIRVTVISSSGVVIAETGSVDVSSMENHIDRKEVQSALKGKSEVVTRYSSTLGRDMMYYAKKVAVDGDYVFIRTATPTETVTAYLVKTIPLMLSILFAVLIVAVISSYFICDKLVKPYRAVKTSLQAINNGTYNKTALTKDYPEVNEALSGIDDIAEKISTEIAATNEEKNKLDYIVNNINDGIIVVDCDGNVQMANKKIASIFSIEIDLTGKNIAVLTSNEQLIVAIKNCAFAGENAVFEMYVEKSVFLVTVKKLTAWDSNGDGVAVAILTDVTARKNNEKLRSEFFANASHELKTPLTAIKGFNEFVSINNKDRTLDKPVSQIAKESDRMLALIDDMLKLSKLENEQPVEKTEVSLKAIAEEVIDGLTTIAGEKCITVSVEGDATVFAAQSHVYELIKNLAENAVKYNVENGFVNIKLSETVTKAVLEISDSGIGIEAKDQSRIFERFYRVEKSRSRATGGTGLGLSIVKHVCLLYDADIALKSKPGIGTTVTVTFKK